MQGVEYMCVHTVHENWLVICHCGIWVALVTQVRSLPQICTMKR